MCRAWLVFVLAVLCFGVFFSQDVACQDDYDNKDVSTWSGSWRMSPSGSGSWSLQTRIPMTTGYDTDVSGEGRGKFKKKYKKYMLPLLLAYKLKFFTLIPVLIGGLVLLTGATGLAGFFFALFAAVMGLKGGMHH